jgi:Zn finger protein HypA/HybF involved in hydrogenase expression
VHQVGLVSDALKLALATATAARARRIDRLTFALLVGGHVTEDAVSTLFFALSQGTLAAGADLSFDRRAARWSCWSCGHSFTAASGPTCPRCAETALPAIGEPELSLLSIDVVPDEPADGRVRPSADDSEPEGRADVPGNARPDSAD